MRLLMSSLSATLPAEAYAAMRTQAECLASDDTSLAAERLRGSIMGHRDWLLADGARVQLRQQWRDLFGEFDIVICPVAPTVAFAHDQSADPWCRTIAIDGERHSHGDQLVWAGIATAAGLPSTVIPIGQSAEGLPIGAQILGPMYADLTPLRFAEIVEGSLASFKPPPLQ